MLHISDTRIGLRMARIFTDLQPTVFSPEATLVGSSNKDDFQKSSWAFSDCFFSSSFLRRRSASWRFFSCNSTIRGLAEGGSIDAAAIEAMEVAGWWPPRDMSNCEWPNWRCIMDWGCGYGLGCTKEPKWEAACAAAACAACEGTRPGYTLKNGKMGFRKNHVDSQKKIVVTRTEEPIYKYAKYHERLLYV